MLTEVKGQIPYDITIQAQFSALLQPLPLDLAIPADQDWVLCEIDYTSSDATDPSTLTQGGALVQIHDKSKNNDLQDGPTPIVSLARGNRSRPSLMRPYRFTKGGTGKLDVTNQGTATQLLYITLRGYKVAD